MNAPNLEALVDVYLWRMFWKRVFLRWVRPLYEEPIGPDGVAAGLVVVARKEA